MAIREVVAKSPTSYSLAGRVKDVLDLAREQDKLNANTDSRLSILGDWIEHRHIHVTTTFEVGDETVVLGDATGGAFAVTLPFSDINTIDRDVFIKRLNAGGNNVTVTAQGTDLIDGLGTYVLNAQYMRVHVISDGLGAWHILSN